MNRLANTLKHWLGNIQFFLFSLWFFPCFKTLLSVGDVYSINTLVCYVPHSESTIDEHGILVMSLAISVFHVFGASAITYTQFSQISRHVTTIETIRKTRAQQDAPGSLMWVVPSLLNPFLNFSEAPLTPTTHGTIARAWELEPGMSGIFWHSTSLERKKRHRHWRHLNSRRLCPKFEFSRFPAFFSFRWFLYFIDFS